MTYRYDVFISYRHQDLDTKWANWLIRALEAYRPPRSVVAALRRGGHPHKIFRVFRDEDETAAGGDLSERLKEALRESRSLVVICSRNTPGSTWVNQEIEYFESLGRAERVLPMLVDGEPQDSFPSAIRDHTGLGAGSAVDFEPLAADARPRKELSNREVKHRALLKVIAGALDVKYDDLYQRDRRRRRNRLIVAGSAAALALTIWLSWFAWTRTDAYQVKTVLATAPLLLLSASGDDMSNWCRALVLSGRFDAALTAAESAKETASAGEYGGSRVDVLLAMAKGARAVKRDGDADGLMNKAAELSKDYGPAFSMKMRLKVAKSFIKQGKPKEAKDVIVDAISTTENLESSKEKVDWLRQFASLIAEMGDLEYLRELAQNDREPIVAAVSSIVAAEIAAKTNQPVDAQRLVSMAEVASEHEEVAEDQSYLSAWVVESAASFNLLSTDDGLLDRALKLARQLPSNQEKSSSLRQVVAAMAQLRRFDDAKAILVEITNEDERNTASAIVAKACARAGQADEIKSILSTYDDAGMDRYSVVSDIAEGLAEGHQMAILGQFEDMLSASDKVEIRVIAAEAWRKSGIDTERSKLLDQAAQIARSASGDEEQHEMMERIVAEMTVGGRVEDALALARETSDPYSKTFALLAIAKSKMSQIKLGEMRDLLMEAAAAEEKVQEPDVRAIGLGEIGRLFKKAGDKLEAMKFFRKAVAAASTSGESGSDTIGDVAEEYARLGDLRLARTMAERYCQASDRLRVYTAILLQSQGLSSEQETDESAR